MFLFFSFIVKVSIRSKKKKHFRTLKREQVFKPVEDARLEKLAKAQADAALRDPLPVENAGDHNNNDNGNDNAMETENPTLSTLTKAQREEIMLSRNQYKKRVRAKAAVKKGGKGAAAGGKGKKIPGVLASIGKIRKRGKK
ncbi:hypothetical protein HDU76_002169 [Blyttiomyces sp. JEL0837]|nr:hypothetical protein HDU76_002169 [Blyttiomyces sp. JEL0837]